MQERQTSQLHTRPPRFYFGWAVAVGFTALLVGLAVLPPFVGEELRAALMYGFSTVCHQLPSRTAHIDGVALAACHRCFGIYAGLLVTAVAFVWAWRWEPLLSRHAKYLLAIALVPVGLDWGLHLLGWWTNTPLSRTLTGGFLGLVVGLYVARACVQVTTPGYFSGQVRGRPTVDGGGVPTATTEPR